MRRLVFVALASCYTPPAPTCTGSVIVLAEAPDYSASTLGTIDLVAGVATLQKSNVVLQDPVLATSALRNFVISRKGEAIYEIDHCGSANSNQFSALAPGETGDVDPQDVAVAKNGNLWITRLLVPSLLVTGAPLTTIDMSAFDSDGNPDMKSVDIIGDQAFVTLERLNPYPESHQASQIAVLDTNTTKLVKTITLAGHNPTMTVVKNGLLWLAEPGNYSDAGESAAGVEAIDPSSMTTSIMIPETTFGASVSEIAVSSNCGAAITADATPTVNATSLVTFALDGSKVSPPALSTPGFSLRGLLWTNEAPPRLLVGDATNSGGTFYVHVFSADAACVLTKITDWPIAMPALVFALGD
jgi:hypothetical protein